MKGFTSDVQTNAFDVQYTVEGYANYLSFFDSLFCMRDQE